MTTSKTHVCTLCGAPESPRVFSKYKRGFYRCLSLLVATKEGAT